MDKPSKINAYRAAENGMCQNNWIVRRKLNAVKNDRALSCSPAKLQNVKKSAAFLFAPKQKAGDGLCTSLLVTHDMNTDKSERKTYLWNWGILESAATVRIFALICRIATAACAAMKYSTWWWAIGKNPLALMNDRKYLIICSPVH